MWSTAGFYEGNQLVTINSGSNEAILKYTINGAKPKSTSMSYLTPIDISETTVIRARQFEEEKLPGSIENRSFFINENITLPVISIITPPETLWDEFNGIYPKRMKGREIPARIEFFKSNHTIINE